MCRRIWGTPIFSASLRCFFRTSRELLSPMETAYRLPLLLRAPETREAEEYHTRSQSARHWRTDFLIAFPSVSRPSSTCRTRSGSSASPANRSAIS